MFYRPYIGSWPSDATAQEPEFCVHMHHLRLCIHVHSQQSKRYVLLLLLDYDIGVNPLDCRPVRAGAIVVKDSSSLRSTNDRTNFRATDVLDFDRKCRSIQQVKSTDRSIYTMTFTHPWIFVVVDLRHLMTRFFLPVLSNWTSNFPLLYSPVIKSSLKTRFSMGVTRADHFHSSKPQPPL